MARDKFEVKKGIKLRENTSSNTEQGEIRQESGAFYVHDGSSESELVTDSKTQTLTNKTIDADQNTISNISNAGIKAGAGIDVSKIGNGSVSTTEFDYLDGVTSAIQTQLDGKVDEVSSTDNAITRFDGTTGSVQDSGVIIDDYDNVSGAASITTTGAVTADAELVLQELSSTPSTPSSGYKSIYPKDNGKLYTLDDAGNEVEVGSGSGGGGGKNYFPNQGFELDATGVSTFDDGATYTDGTGGTPAGLTATQNSTTPLEGSGDLEIAKSATDASGDGVTFTSDDIGVKAGRILYARWEWDGTDANYTANDLQVKAYGTGGNAELDVQAISGVTEDSGGNAVLPAIKTKCLVAIYTNSDTETIRLSFHLPSDSATSSAWSCFVDEMEIFPEATAIGHVSSNEVSYSPTLVGFGTTTNNDFWWSRSGEYMYLRGRWTAGTNTATEAQIPLPTGYTISTDVTGPSAVGTFTLNNASAGSNSHALIATGGDAFLNFGFRSASQTGLDIADGDELVSSTTYSFFAKVKIQGWQASGSTGFTDIANQMIYINYRVASGAANTSIDTATNTTVDFNTLVYESHEGLVTTGASWAFTAPRSGVYHVEGQVDWAGTINTRKWVRVVVNGSEEHIMGDVSIPCFQVSGSTDLQLNAGDTVTLQAYQAVGSTQNLDNSGFGYNVVSITSWPEIQNFAQIAGGGLKSRQVFTASGAWTRPVGIRKVLVKVVGAGGGGGGSSTTDQRIGGGGGAGGFVEKFIDVSTINTATVTIGSGGSGGAAGNNDGTAGGNSSWSDGTSTLTANGGSGGAHGVAASSHAAGGTATGGDINIPGQIGGANVGRSGAEVSGEGGSTFLGLGGRAGAGNGVNGTTGTGYGSGGGGGTRGSGSSAAGGNGASGIIIVEEYS